MPQLRRFAWTLLLPCPSLCNDSCLGSDARKLRRPRSCSTSAWSMSLLCRFIWVRPVPGQSRYMPVIVNDTGYANSEGASDSAHRLLLWTFQLCNTDGYDASIILVMAAMNVVFRGFSAFFALLRVVPELSASFRSPRWRRVLCHRGLLHNETVATCWH